MQFVILAMIVVVMSFQYLVSLGWLPHLFSYSPEILGAAACVAVVVMGVQNRFQYVRPVYWLVFGAIGLVVVCGAVVNLLEPGPLFAGIRLNLRALPFFFLPAVLALNERQLRVQFTVLLAFCALQLPLAWYQRTHTRLSAGGWSTGDYTFGTLMDSGVLSVFLICAACVLTGVYLRRRMHLGLYIFWMVILLLPTTLNETKATLLLVPIALMTTLLAGSARGTRLKNLFLGFVVVAGFLAMFVPIYDHFQAPRWGYGILDFLTMSGRVDEYLVKGTEIGDKAPAGRFDGVRAAVAELSKDPTKLLVGFGIGNASESSLGRQFEGAYFRKFSAFPAITLRNVLLDYGVLGLGLILLLHWRIFLDGVAVAGRDRGLVGALAMGWAGTTAVIVLSYAYTELIANVATSYLYWYFSGLVAASRMRSVQADGSLLGSESASSVVRGDQLGGPLVEIRSPSRSTVSR